MKSDNIKLGVIIMDQHVRELMKAIAIGIIATADALTITADETKKVSKPSDKLKNFWRIEKNEASRIQELLLDVQKGMFNGVLHVGKIRAAMKLSEDFLAEAKMDPENDQKKIDDAKKMEREMKVIVKQMDYLMGKIIE